MIDASQVTACLVTRGDVDMTEIIDSLPFAKVIVYDNSREPDLGVYGRYAAVERADTDFVYVQDDDCLLAPEAFEQMIELAFSETVTIAWGDQKRDIPPALVANMPLRFRAHYPDSCLVGFGAIFARELPSHAFDRYFVWDAREHKRPWIKETRYGFDVDPYAQWAFYRECDTVFTALTPRVLIDVPYTDLPWANADNRLWKQREHFGERRRMLNLVRQVRDA